MALRSSEVDIRRNPSSGAILRWAALCVFLCLTACSPTRVDSVDGIGAVPAPSSLEMVDCLLPGQVRKLGSSLTYLTARRPARVAETECEIRGGEYVAYDRANYKTALAVWLESARLGDPRAQNYVGEIYAKGMGTSPDYQLAAEWYGKAAEQDFPQAKINLGYLYEQGLGVEKNLVTALNLYRQATGVSDDSLQFSSELERIRVSNRELDELKRHVEEQSSRVASLNLQLADAREELKRLEAQPPETVTSADSESLLADKRREISQLQQKLAARNTEYQSVKDSLISTQQDLDQAREKIYSAYRENRSLREQLEITLRRLDDKESRLEELSALKNEFQDRLRASAQATDKGYSQEQIALLKSQLQDSQAKIDQLQKEKMQLQSESEDLYARIEPEIDSTRSELTFRSLSRRMDRSADVENSGVNQSPSIAKVQKKLGKFYALVIGNNEYGSVEKLSTAVNDARSVNAILKNKFGFETELLINATKSDLITALWKLKQRMSDIDNLVVYYAGHGEVNEGGNKGYWLMTDARDSDPTTWIANNTLTEFISSLPVKRVMVIADSCYSGTLSSIALSGRPIDDLYTPDKALRLADAGAQLVLTSGGVSPVLDSSGGSHSIFAQALLETLDKRQGTLNGYDLFLDVKAKVRSRASDLGVEQQPTYAPLAFAHKGGEFYFQQAN